MHGLLLSLKNEIVRVAPLGRVNVVCPGWTESPMTRTTLTDPDLVARVTRTMPLRKVAQPEDVARQVVVLASDELSGHVTGQVVTVAGGMEGRLLHTERCDKGGAAGRPAAPFTPDAAGMVAVSPVATERSLGSFGLPALNL